MSGITEFHGFRYGGKFYDTREAAEHAARLEKAREGIDSAVGVLAEELAELLNLNGVDGDFAASVAEGVCADWFPIHQDRIERSNAFFKALDAAANAYETFTNLRPVATSGEEKRE